MHLEDMKKQPDINEDKERCSCESSQDHANPELPSLDNTKKRTATNKVIQ